ncbi:MAG: hypothetical protein OEW35_05840 [Gammaproteobacteria bacterium]|nr:hypothetical protein [Gammaproteobacteria bacterium]MDH4256765.1 hypothetical protein [Gammaproteobacteria bacterium]MDH5311067.1 hypothetical protein [Gammaproteobacteria bacterium]
MRRILSLGIILMTLSACGPKPGDAPASAGIEDLAREYLFLELATGWHDPAHVDAYFGPAEIQAEAEASQLSLDAIRVRATALAARLRVLQGERTGPESARLDGLLARLQAMETRIALNQGSTLPFDEESRQLFGVQAPDLDASYFEAILADIDALLPGDGPLSERVNDFQDRFVIPPDRLSAVFDAAIAECRRRTLQNIELPGNESFTLEYVTGKPWSGYNWYQGNAQSVIQINTDLPIFISRAVDLGCHEGYPGHHTYNALLEQNLVIGKGWLEFSLYPLFSPQSLIAEGSGNYGIDLAFPGAERIEFEKSVLFPLTGLDATEADRYYALQGLLARLSYAGNEAARDFLDGRIDRDQAVQWLVDYALNSPERALQRTQFIDSYRSYVINYNLGQDMVRGYVERDTSTADDRWARFERMLSNPVLPRDLE